MKLREIILDFTSLLDVIMIILFWFILNYQNETTKIRNKAEEAERTAIAAQSAAEEKRSEAEHMLQVADNQLEELANANERQAYNIKALRDFRDCQSLQLRLNSYKGSWNVVVSIGSDQELGCIYSTEEKKFGEKLFEMLENEGIEDDATIICILSYNSKDGGSRTSLESVEEQLKTVTKRNHHFYYTKMNRA